MSMAGKCHNHIQQTNPWHRVEESKNDHSQMTLGTQQRKATSSLFPQRDDCKTRKNTKYCKTKQGHNTKPHKQWEQQQ